MGANILNAKARSMIRHNEQFESLPRFRILNGTRGTIIDTWYGGDSCLYLRKIQSHASHFQKGTLTSFDPDVAFLILTSQISRSQPAVAEDALRFLRIVPIAGRYGRPFDRQMATLPRGQAISLLVHDP